MHGFRFRNYRPLDFFSCGNLRLTRVINAKYSMTCSLMKDWGYKLVDEIVWIKKTINGKIAKGHGYYLQHAKETCLVGVKVG